MKRIISYVIFIGSCAICAGILLLVVLDAIIMPFVVDVPSVQVPYLKRMPFDKAKDRLSEWGLKTIISDSAYHDDIPHGAVVDHRPATSQRVKQGRAITLNLSRGPRLFTVPDVRSASIREAQLKLESNSLQIGSIKYVSSNEVPQSVVMDQIPRTGEMLPKAGLIELYVSSGSPEALKSTPNVVFTSIESVEDSLLKYEMILGEISFRVDNKQPEGTIIGQFPNPGTPTQRNTPINIEISAIDSQNNR